MKRLITKLAAGSMLVALPLAALAHDDDYRHGGRDERGRYARHYDHDWKRGPRYVYVPAPVYRPREVVRVVERPLYVPAPVPLPYPRPYSEPVNSVDIGFRIFF
jgi:hypothetical protein